MGRFYCAKEFADTWSAVEADSAEDAARALGDCDPPEYGPSAYLWVEVLDADAHPDPQGPPDPEGTWYALRYDPAEPPCMPARAHSWARPHEVVGGSEERPGRWVDGGVASQFEVCRHCGAYRVTRIWLGNPNGIETVEFEDADERSLRWLARQPREE